MSVNLGQCIVTLLGHNWDLNSILLFKLLHFNFEWIVFCDLVSCKDNFILHKSDFSCLIWQCWNISGTTMWPQAIGTTSHPNFGMHTGSQGPNPAIFSQNCPNRAMLPGNRLMINSFCNSRQPKTWPEVQLKAFLAFNPLRRKFFFSSFFGT